MARQSVQFLVEVYGEAAAAACGERLLWGQGSFSWKTEASSGLRTQCSWALFLDVCTESLPLAQYSPDAHWLWDGGAIVFYPEQHSRKRTGLEGRPT